MAIGEESVSEVLDLLDWKRRVFALYSEVRNAGDPRAAWERWREVRDGLFRDHPQSPRPGYEGLEYFDYDPAWRFLAETVPAEPEPRKMDADTMARLEPAVSRSECPVCGARRHQRCRNLLFPQHFAPTHPERASGQ